MTPRYERYRRSRHRRRGPDFDSIHRLSLAHFEASRKKIEEWTKLIASQSQELTPKPITLKAEHEH